MTTLGNPHVELDEWLREAERTADEATETIIRSYTVMEEVDTDVMDNLLMEAVERAISGMESNGLVAPPHGYRPRPGDIVVNEDETYVVEDDQIAEAWAASLEGWDPHFNYAEMGYGYEDEDLVRG